MAENLKEGKRIKTSTLRINLQADNDEDGTTYISPLWMNPKVDGVEFNKDRTDTSLWLKQSWSSGKVFTTYGNTTPVNESSSDEEDSKSDTTISPPTLQIPWPRSLQQKRVVNFNLVNTMLKATSKFKSLPLQQREDRLTFPGEQARRKSSIGVLAELNDKKNVKKRPSNEPDTDELNKIGGVVPRRVSSDQLDAIVARVGRATTSSRARSACVRRVFFPEPKQPVIQRVRVDYLVFAPTKFRGLKRVSAEEIKQITERLSKFNIERWPPNSCRRDDNSSFRRPKVMKSHTTLGLKNC